jgi:hypothetical protein
MARGWTCWRSRPISSFELTAHARAILRRSADTYIEMLKAKHKPKLYNYLSYPVGVETVARGLDGIAQFDEVELRFWPHPGVSATRFHDIVQNDQPHLILEATFERWDKRPAISKGFEALLHGVWSIRVYPTRRQLKAPAKALLIAEGIPALRRWFEKKRSPSWYWGRKSFKVHFNPADASLKTEELTEKI